MITTKKDIIIPAGTELKQAPWKTTREGYHGEHVIGFGDDGVAFFTVDIESAELNPDYFEVSE